MQALTIHIFNLVTGDPDQPSAQGRSAVERGETVQCSKKYVLNDIIDEIRARSETIASVRIDGIDMGGDKLRGRFPVLSENGGNELAFVDTKCERLDRRLGR